MPLSVGIAVGSGAGNMRGMEREALSSGTYRGCQVGTLEKSGAMAKLGVHLAVVTALTAG